MPTYEYRCDNCGNDFDRVRSMKEDTKTCDCDCGATARQIFTSVPNVDSYFHGSFNRENPCDKPFRF